MSRHPRGRRPALPAWPALRVRAVVNGLAALTGGIGLLWLCWSALGFTVFDASQIPAVVRVLSLWFAVALPIAWLAIGAHLVVAAVAAGDRELVAHGAASWDPGTHDDVLRGVRVRGWRLGRGESRRVSGPTVGWLPELSPVGLAPLAAGLLALLIMLAWMARGYGLGVIALIIAILWLGWRLVRAWQAWTDVREARERGAREPRAGHGPDASRGASGEDEAATPDEAWDDEPAPAPEAGADRRGPGQRFGGAAQDPEEAAEATAILPLYDEDDDAPRPVRRGQRGGNGARSTERATAELPETDPDEPVRRGSRQTRREPPEREVLVDRSVQRAIRAKQAARGDGPPDGGASPPPPRSSKRSRRGGARPARPTGADTEDLPIERARDNSAHRGGAGAPSAADAEQEIYGREVQAASLLSYLSRRRDERR